MTKSILPVRSGRYLTATAPIFAALMFAAIAIAAAPAHGQAAGGRQPTSARQKRDAQVFGRLGKAWAAFYEGKYEAGVKLAGPLLKLSDSRYLWVVVEAAHIQARCYWVHGSRGSRARARQIWKKLEKLSTDNSLRTRLKIARALELESAGAPARLDQGIAILEQIVRDRQMHTATPEAGIDLARLYVQARRFDDAEKVLKFVIGLLSDKRTLIRMELPDAGIVRPYVTAARAALNRLKFERDTGREEFEAAERLRRQGQWRKAHRAYQAVVNDFGDTDYAPRSELAMGHCLVGLRRVAQAVAHWKKFIEIKPAGPWRAQALVALIDIYLEEQLNLPEAGKYATLARSSLPTAVADEKAGESWEAAAFDIHLRIGVVRFCEGKGGGMKDIAAEAFEAARKLTRKKTTIESLDALIAAARAGKAVIPDDCRPTAGSPVPGPQSQVAVALSLGVIYHLASRDEQASAFFDRVLGTPASPGKRPRRAMRGATAAQRAFAIFGKGSILQAQRNPSTAKARFLASIKAFAGGTWHDETLYRIATIIQDEAEAKFGSTSPTTSGSAAKQSTRKARNAKQRATAANAEKKRLAALLKAKGAALPYWRKLIKDYPKSPRREPAMYNVGVLLYELAAAAPAAQSEKMFKEAAAALSAFCTAYPESQFAGDAYVKHIDIALERMFDLDLAWQLAHQAQGWVEQVSGNTLARSPSAPAAWMVRIPPLSGDDVQQSVYQSLLRVGLIAYIKKDYTVAKNAIARAGAQHPPTRPTSDVDISRVGLHFFLTKAILKRSRLTPDELLNSIKSARLRTAVQVADVYRMCLRSDKASALYTRMLERQTPFANTPLSVEAYSLFQLGRISVRDASTRAAGLDYLERLYDRKYKNFPWSVEGIFRLGVFTFNITQDPRKAMPHYKYVFTKYPEHPVAERSLYHYCQNASRLGDAALAVPACNRFVSSYPDSDWIAHVRALLKKMSSLNQ